MTTLRHFCLISLDSPFMFSLFSLHCLLLARAVAPGHWSTYCNANWRKVASVSIVLVCQLAVILEVKYRRAAQKIRRTRNNPLHSLHLRAVLNHKKIIRDRMKGRRFAFYFRRLPPNLILLRIFINNRVNLPTLHHMQWFLAAVCCSGVCQSKLHGCIVYRKYFGME